MRFLGGEAPGSRALGSRTLHVALMALFAVLFAAFLLYASAAWAQTADEADTAEGAEAAQSEGQPDEAEDEEAEDEGADEQGSEDDGKPDDEASEDDEEIRLEGKPVEDEDSEQVMKTPEEAAEDEVAEKISEAEDLETLADGELVGEIAIAQDRGNDNDVDTIVIFRGDCEVREGASVVLRRDSQYGGGRGTFIDNRNVQIIADNNQIRIVGPNPNQTNEDIDPIGQPKSFLDPGETYEVVASTGISCDDGGDGGGGGNNNCLSLVDLDDGGTAVIRSNGPVTATVIIDTADETDTSFVNFRVLYATSNPAGSIQVSLTSEDGQDVAINRTISGSGRGVLNTEIKLNTVYNLDVTPSNQGFTILPEGGPGTGNDRCTSPGQLPTPPGVSSNRVINIIERTGALPDTGEGDSPTTSATGERASTPASVLFSILSIVGFTGLLFLRRLGAR